MNEVLLHAIIGKNATNIMKEDKNNTNYMISSFT